MHYSIPFTRIYHYEKNVDVIKLGTYTQSPSWKGQLSQISSLIRIEFRKSTKICSSTALWYLEKTMLTLQRNNKWTHFPFRQCVHFGSIYFMVPKPHKHCMHCNSKYIICHSARRAFNLVWEYAGSVPVHPEVVRSGAAVSFLYRTLYTIFYVKIYLMLIFM